MVEDKAGRPGRKGRKGRPAGRRAPGGGSGGGGTPGSRGEDPGWESELRAREEEVAAYEERILVREFMQRLAFNTGKVRAGPAADGDAALPSNAPPIRPSALLLVIWHARAFPPSSVAVHRLAGSHSCLSCWAPATGMCACLLRGAAMVWAYPGGQTCRRRLPSAACQCREPLRAPAESPHTWLTWRQ